MIASSRSAALLLLASLACSGRDDSARGGSADKSPGGTFVVSTAADAGTMLPPYSDDAMSRAAVILLYDKLADIGPKLNTFGDEGFEPRLAERWTWAPDSLSITFHLNPRAKWHDGTPVRARDVVTGFEITRDPKVGSSSGPLVVGIDSVTARDSLTAVVWYKRRAPEQFYELTHQMWPLPTHLLEGADRAQLRAHALSTTPVGSGPYRLRRWERGSVIEFVADTTHYRGRPNLDRVLFMIAPDPNAGVTRVLAGEADFWELLRPNNVADVAKNPNLKTVPYGALQYGFLSFNLRDARNRARPHPVLGDRGVRRALTMAIDRRAMVKNVFDSLAKPALGPFPSGLSSADTTLQQIPFDVEGAKRLLDSLGWRDANGDGVREKGGRQLEFGIMVPTSSAPRMQFAVLLQEQFRQVGVKANVEAMEFTAMRTRMSSRAFDSYLGLWGTDPTPSGIRQTWGTQGARASDGSNYGSYENPAVDALVDTALASFDPAAARATFKRAYQMVLDDAPAIWLYEPRPYVIAHKRLRLDGMRADGWFYGIEKFWIPENERIPRDNIGLGRDAPARAADTARSDTARGGTKTP